jgi:hypothetical protein
MDDETNDLTEVVTEMISLAEAGIAPGPERLQAWALAILLVIGDDVRVIATIH